MASPNDLKPVCEAAGPGEAHIIASMLREAGIEAFVFDTAAQTLQWEAPRIINPYLVHVQRADLEQARQMIRTNREESVDLDWDEVDGGPASDKSIRISDHHNKGTRKTKDKSKRYMHILLAFFTIIIVAKIVNYFNNQNSQKKPYSSIWEPQPPRPASQ